MAPEAISTQNGGRGADFMSMCRHTGCKPINFYWTRDRDRSRDRVRSRDHEKRNDNKLLMLHYTTISTLCLENVFQFGLKTILKLFLHICPLTYFNNS